MRVLMIWWQVPEECDVYVLEGDMANAALVAAGQFEGSARERNPAQQEALDKISTWLADEKPEPVLKGVDAGTQYSLAEHKADFLVFCGFYM